MSRGTHADGRIIRLLADEPWPPHDDTGDLEGATDRPLRYVAASTVSLTLGPTIQIGGYLRPGQARHRSHSVGSMRRPCRSGPERSAAVLAAVVVAPAGSQRGRPFHRSCSTVIGRDRIRCPVAWVRAQRSPAFASRAAIGFAEVMGEARDTRWPSSPPTGWRSRRICSKSKGPRLEQDWHEPYAIYEHASPGPGRPACVWVGELTGERRHPQAGYTRQL